MAMSSSELEQAFGFTPDDLAVNAGGGFSRSQMELLDKTRRQRGCGQRVAAAAIMGTTALLLAVFYFSMDRNSEGFKEAFPYMLGFCLGFGLIFTAFFLVGMYRSRDLKNGTISNTRGALRKWTKNYRYGTAYYAEVGGEKFRLLSPDQMRALNENAVYSIYFVRNPPIHLILSLEVVE